MGINQSSDSKILLNVKYPVKIGNVFKLSIAEERANSLSHGVMAGLMLLALPACAVFGYQKSGVALSIGYSVFIIGLFQMFLTSSLYHSMPFGTRYKTVFRTFDHSSIYIAIAGTFTPICLTDFAGRLGKFVLICQWLVAVLGIVMNFLSKKTKTKASVGIYLIMGWSAILLVPGIIQNKLWGFLIFIILGGLLYSIGVIFYSKKSKAWFHFIWHLFIIGASICHFIAIIFYI